MSARRVDSGLADMQDYPMSANWYWLLAWFMSVGRALMAQHKSATKAAKDRDPVEVERDMSARLCLQSAMETTARLCSTMRAAGVVEEKGMVQCAALMLTARAIALRDVTALPTTGGWYALMRTWRGEVQRLRDQLASAVMDCPRRDPAVLEADMIASADAALLVELADQLIERFEREWK